MLLSLTLLVFIFQSSVEFRLPITPIVLLHVFCASLCGIRGVHQSAESLWELWQQGRMQGESVCWLWIDSESFHCFETSIRVMLSSPLPVHSCSRLVRINRGVSRVPFQHGLRRFDDTGSTPGEHGALVEGTRFASRV